MKRFVSLALLLALTILSQPAVFSHCEVPCGIYDDEMRFKQIAEHIQTIEKAMQQVNQLSDHTPQNFNQIVRWVMNKEKHAEEIQHIISQYFLTQRIKSVDPSDRQATEKYFEKLSLCHQILVYAMQCKQTTDEGNTKKLKSTVEQFEKVYFSKKKSPNNPPFPKL
jgi:nickel superoxide dismutase